jgi:hypothetical protein
MTPIPRSIIMSEIAMLARNSRRLRVFSRSLVIFPEAQNRHRTTTELRKSTRFSSPKTRHMADPEDCCYYWHAQFKFKTNEDKNKDRDDRFRVCEWPIGRRNRGTYRENSFPNGDESTAPLQFNTVLEDLIT